MIPVHSNVIETLVVFFCFCCAVLFFSVLCLQKIPKHFVKKFGELFKYETSSISRKIMIPVYSNVIETLVVFFCFCCAVLFFSVLCLQKIPKHFVKKFGELFMIYYTQCSSAYIRMRSTRARGATLDMATRGGSAKDVKAAHAHKLMIANKVLSIVVVLVIVLLMNYVLVSTAAIHQTKTTATIHQTKTTAAIQLNVLYAHLRQIALGPGATTSQTDNVKHRFVLQV